MSHTTFRSFEPLSRGLEAARLEIVRRLQSKGLPLSVSVNRPVAVASDSGTRIEWKETEISSINSSQVSWNVVDDKPEFLALGLKTEMGPLAQRLYDETDLIDRPHSFVPDWRTPDALRYRYLVQIAT